MLTQLLLAITLLLPQQATAKADPLTTATQANDLKAVRQLLKAGANPDPRDADGQTPLMYAAWRGYTDIMDELLKANANPNARDKNGTPVLAYSFGRTDSYSADTLIRAGARVDYRDENGETTLMMAARMNNPRLFHVLVSHGVDPNARDKDGNTALILCVSWRIIDVGYGGQEEDTAIAAAVLVALGTDINARNNDGQTALIRSVSYWHSAAMKALLNLGARVNIPDKLGRTALTFGSSNPSARKDFLEPLLTHGAKPNLMTALQMGSFKTGIELINAGADIHQVGSRMATPLMVACEWGNPEAVRVLLKRGAAVNVRDADGDTPLMIAVSGRRQFGQIGATWYDHGVMSSRPAIIRMLAAAGANVNARGTGIRSDSALTMAIETKAQNCALALLDCGANVNITEQGFSSAIARAADAGLDGLVQAMIRRGADVKTARNDVLQSAASHCSPVTLRAIIRAGADINAFGTYGGTALMVAAEGNLANTQALLEAGANVNLRTPHGQSVLTEALTSAPKSGIPELLIAHHAQIGLLEALLMGKRDLALDLIKSDVRIEAETSGRKTPLLLACELGDIQIVQELLNRGAKCERGRTADRSPLIAAACGSGEVIFEKGGSHVSHYEWHDFGKRGSDRIALVRLLLDHGAPADQSDSYGNTPLTLASRKGDIAMMQFLLDSGAKVNLYSAVQGPFSEGDPPIVEAAEHGGVEAVKLLLAHGADVNLRNGDGHEPAIVAAVRNEQTEVVRVLLSNGASIAVRSTSGEAPMEIAVENKSTAIIALLEEAEKTHSGSE